MLPLFLIHNQFVKVVPNRLCHLVNRLSIIIVISIFFHFNLTAGNTFGPGKKPTKLEFLVFEGEIPEAAEEEWLRTHLKGFKDPGKDKLSYPDGRLRVTLTKVKLPPVPADYVLQVPEYFNHSLYLVKPGSIKHLSKQGNLRYLQFFIPRAYFITAKDSLTIISMFSSPYRHGMELTIFDEKYFFERTITDLLFKGATLLVLVITLYYVLIFFLANRERIYAFYILYLLLAFVYLLYGWGFLTANLLPPLPYYYQITLPYVLMTLAVFFYGLEYLRSFNVKFPSFNIILIWVGTRFLLFFTGYFTGNLIFNHPAIDFFFILPVVILVLKTVIKNGVQIFSFGASYLCIAIFLFLHSVEKYIWADSNFLVKEADNRTVSYYLPLIIILEIFLFNFSLYHLFRKKRKEAEEKQAEVMLLKDQLNTKLETLVNQRTVELEQANLVILKQAETLKQLNISLEEENQHLTEEIELIKKSKVLAADLTFKEFLEVFPNEESCYQLMASLKWQNGYACKKCGFKKYYQGKTPFSRKCRLCKTEESPTAQTNLDGIKIPLTKAFYIIFSAYRKTRVSLSALSQELDLRTGTCTRYYHNAKELMKHKKLNNWTQGII